MANRHPSNPSHQRPTTTTNSRSRNRAHDPKESQPPSRTRPQKNFNLFSAFRRPQMPSVFNIVRASIYGTVLLWTVITLAISAHFNALLTTNDLTRFIPFAIFVCSVTLAFILALLLFGFKKANPIATRVELGVIGFLGVLWLALVAFLFSSDAEDADVECYSANHDLVEVPGFSTETYQAQYRVLEAFSVFNLILLWGFLLFVLFLALRHQYNGDKEVWFAPVTSYSWFYRYPATAEDKEPKLPPPVTAPVDRSRKRGGGALSAVPEKSKDRRAAKARDTSRSRNDHHRSQSQRSQPFPSQAAELPKYAYKHGYWLPQAPPPPPKATAQPGRARASRSSSTRERTDVITANRRDKYHRDASPRR